jgi:NAD(P)H-flavin reductase
MIALSPRLYSRFAAPLEECSSVDVTDEVSAAMEGSARFVFVPLLRHLAAAEFSENRVRLFTGIIEPSDTYAVVGVAVFRDLEHIGRSVVVKLHGQRIRREDVVGDITALLPRDVLICGRVGDVCRQHPTHT